MKKNKPRLPEGGAIEDSSAMTMEQYSETMKKQLGKEYIRFADNVIGKINPTQNSLVLEIGPGPGWAGINLLKKRTDLKLEGQEASPDMVRVATENAEKEGLIERAHYSTGVGEEMKGIPDQHYDLVISRDSLHHWTDPKKVFLEIKRVLKPDGKLYIHDHRRDLNFFGKLIVTVFSALIPGGMGKYWRSSIAAAYTREEIQTIFKELQINQWIIYTNFMDLVIYKT
jgi:ubiquinone/menaquinone biosynthesis C-methylase UbiE